MTGQPTATQPVVRRTPAQIAADDLDEATALVLKTERRVIQLEAELAKAKERLGRQQTIRDWAAHPLLQPTLDVPDQRAVGDE